jgi:hypothetical protein
MTSDELRLCLRGAALVALAVVLGGVWPLVR